MPEVKPDRVVALRQDVYEKLVKELTPPIVTQVTTELQAGYMLGIQQVLQKLRDGWVVGS